MDILILGNGFDLAHGLPTKYVDFLEFIKKYRAATEMGFRGKWDKFEDINIKANVPTNYVFHDYVEHLFKDAIFGKIVDNLSAISNAANENFLINHFQKNCKYINKGWIDFETEISHLVQELEKIIQCSNIQAQNFGIFKELVKNTTNKWMHEDTEDVLISMHHSLIELTEILEIYLLHVVSEIPITVFSPDIKSLTPDKILNFNYTDTYSRVYETSRDVEYHYVHGKVRDNLSGGFNNMVLGIDEYYKDDRKNSDTTFIYFKKYFQRIHKETGGTYKNWSDRIKREYAAHLKRLDFADYREKHKMLASGKENQSSAVNRMVARAVRDMPVPSLGKNNVYIFGHSLDITDGDILRELILNENVNTIIYYYNRSDYADKIANLVKIIGQDELIRRTGGITKTISFCQQQPMELCVVDKLESDSNNE